MKRLLLIVIASLCLSGCGRYYSEADYIELTNAIDEVIDKVNDLEVQNEDLNDRLIAKQDIIDELNAEIDDLNIEIDSLNEQINNLTYKPYPQSSNTNGIGPFIGNSDTYVFHRRTCSYLPSKLNSVYYVTRFAALSDGMRPCQHCNP